jgi:8-oxo-dGTP diphosphatase
LFVKTNLLDQVDQLPEKYCYPYPRPAVTVDAVIFCHVVEGVKVLLIRRRNPPFAGSWAFPGGFVDEDETLEQAVSRETFEEAGVEKLNFRQFKAYSDPQRDPRHRTITIVFVAFSENELQLKSGDDAAEAEWFNLNKLPEMAFDHGVILKEIINELKF